ncbi:ornithine cyclodeaminase family protein [Shewanella sp. FJAT-52076]|uniref:ornithine cyclodeaminase family protein n=1 Tax=Shewanella sp. FJAT-52076 TaxID=2864202 RepID=UPI001C659BDC|nr:ornithine cyclodeaminase family protein [Shewanella sp. FJAT-52076]QYJ74399.1 ornithine cyclodeaminase family protein [Shewanella sp. FJAT-52076]
MKIIDGNQVQQKLTFPTLVAALKQQLCRPFTMPQRQVYALSDTADNQHAFALLPAWDEESIAVKAFTYLPDNPVKNPGCESLYSQILLFDRASGVPQALIDGTSVTYWRTAAISALAASFLAREDSRKLLLCATGNLATYMALAHASVRPITEIRVWGRNPQKVATTIAAIGAQRADIEVTAADALQVDVPWADIISCATGSPTPLFPGEWVTPGTHTDFVGNHHKDCRECDTHLIANAHVYVDSRLNVFNEAGELLIPVSEGRFSLDEVKAELSELCQGLEQGRLSDTDITLFKSVGSALADLAGARLVFKVLQEQ